MRFSRTISVILLFLSLGSGCIRPLPPDYTGIVYDAATKFPMKGVVVLAEYTESGGVMFGHSGHWCVKSMAVRTGSDGSYRFPIGKNRYGPTSVAAFVPGYYTKAQLIIATGDPERSYSGDGHDFYLAKQDPANINLRITEPIEMCDRAANKMDAEAANQFQEMVDAERLRIQSGISL